MPRPGGVDLRAVGMADLVTLANVMLRQAEKTTTPRAYLDALITSKFTSANSQGGAIISTTVNGKSVTFQGIPGTTVADYMAAADLALSCLERGVPRVPRTTFPIYR